MPYDTIDAHVHAWPADRTRYPTAPGRPVPAVEGDVGLLLTEMDSERIQRAVVVQTPWYEHDNRYLVDAVRAHPDRLIPVGYLPDPTAATAVAELERQHLEDHMAGFRLHLIDQDIIAGVAAGRSAPLLDRAGELGVPISLLYWDQSLHDLVGELATRHSRTRFVVDHMGSIHAGQDFRPLARQAEHPNVYVKLSLHTILSAEEFPWRDLHPLQEALLHAFGANRLLWGSNFPMHTDTLPYSPRLECVRTWLPFLSPIDRSWVLGRTAQQLWTWPARHAGDRA